MKTYKLIMLVTAIIVFNSCKKTVYNPDDVDPAPNDSTQVETESFEIPFKETEANLKTIHINLNGNNSYDAIFDTGCSMVLISPLECVDLLKQGTLKESDETTPVEAGIADGSSNYMQAYILREVTVLDDQGNPHTVRDIKAAVAPNINASILIGTSVIDNLAKKSYTVDLERKMIIFQ